MPSDILILLIAILLFVCYFIYDWFLWRKSGDKYSAIRGMLLKNGIDSAFGFFIALILVAFVIIIFFVFTQRNYAEYVKIKRLIIATGCVYVGSVMLLNYWGKKFLIKQGKEPKPKDGYKGILQTYKDAVEKEKEKQRKKQQEKDEESLF